MHDYEPISALNWIIHYAFIASNLSIFRHLLDERTPGDKNDTVDDTLAYRKRKVYAFVVNGVGHIFGFGFLIAHSLIRSRPNALYQQIHNFSHYFLKLSSMSLGYCLLAPPLISCVITGFVAYAIWIGQLSFQNTPGIILNNLGLFAILQSSNKVFPRKFKIGYIMLMLMPMISLFMSKTFGGGGRDIVHLIDASLLTLSSMIQRYSLMMNEVK